MDLLKPLFIDLSKKLRIFIENANKEYFYISR